VGEESQGKGHFKMRFFKTFTLLFALSIGGVAHAGKADVIEVEIKKTGENTYQFHVTVLHHDEGWKHYVDKWDIVAPDGAVLGTRTLYHPHVDEKPFTRSLSGLNIPKGIGRVTIRAHDSVHGYGGKVVTVGLPQ